MKAYLSISRSNEEGLLVIALASGGVGKQGFSTTHTRFDTENFAKWSRIGIKQSNMFLGFVSETGEHAETVIQEHRTALEVGTPALLLIENTISLPTNFDLKNVIIFSRENPQAAIDEINGKKRVYEDNAVDTFAWLFGSEALISVLEEMKRLELVP